MLAEGQQVEFEFTQGPKGLQATKVVKLKQRAALSHQPGRRAG